MSTDCMSLSLLPWRRRAQIAEMNRRLVEMIAREHEAHAAALRAIDQLGMTAVRLAEALKVAQDSPSPVALVAEQRAKETPK